MKKIPLFLLILFTPCLIRAQHDNSSVNKNTQKVWIKNKITEIKKTGLYVLPVAEPEINITPGYESCSFSLTRDSRIVFPDKSHLDIFMHSSHSNPVIGDVSIAITSKGKTFVNYGHICGGSIAFVQSQPTAPKEATEFIKNFKADTDDSGWIKWK